MTDAGTNETEKELGHPFLVVRIVMPSSVVIQNLPSDLQMRAQANVERANRLFRSRTLPLPNCDGRLCDGSVFDVRQLSSDVDSVIVDGIADEDARRALAVQAGNDKGRIGTRVYVTVMETADGPTFELRSASNLLGKYWYRHQEIELFESFKLIDDLKAARERGETGEDLFKPKPPAPPRR